MVQIRRGLSWYISINWNLYHSMQLCWVNMHKHGRGWALSSWKVWSDSIQPLQNNSLKCIKYLQLLEAIFVDGSGCINTIFEGNLEHFLPITLIAVKNLGLGSNLVWRIKNIPNFVEGPWVLASSKLCHIPWKGLEEFNYLIKNERTWWPSWLTNRVEEHNFGQESWVLAFCKIWWHPVPLLEIRCQCVSQSLPFVAKLTDQIEKRNMVEGHWVLGSC